VRAKISPFNSPSTGFCASILRITGDFQRPELDTRGWLAYGFALKKEIPMKWLQTPRGRAL
jgi:hypothetical protein